jgi:hypothetical protein
MHLLIATRGYKPDVDRFITELQGKYFPYKCDKDKTNYAVAMNVQPIQLWSLVFPEDSLQQVLRTIEPRAFSGGMRKVSFVLRKVLGLKDLPKIDDKVLPMPIYKTNIEIAALGIKDDFKITDGELKGGEGL